MHRGPGRQRARGKRVRQSWVSAGSTQHFEETKLTEEGTPSVREGSLNSQDTTPRRGQEKETPYTESEGQGPVWWKERIREDHCLQGMEVCGEKAHFLSSLLKALDGLLYVLLTRTKPPREKNKASTWFALSKSEVSSVVWIQPLKSTLSGLKLLVRAPRGLIIWGHCPSSSIHLGSCSNYIEREEVESLPGVGIAFAFYND